ncbi:outer membrane protein transport protein, partial [Chitinivorax sp. B]|uniref:OmpP1/FadL family transporter n=1 Tax=Chitinivorax sp. B TaxID=2502235 RepID=UPI0010F6363D
TGGGQAGGKGILPALVLAWPLSPQLALGLSVSAPYGADTKFDEDWSGRYTSLKTEMAAINIHPSVAWRLNDHWSVGAGLNAIHIDADLSKALDFRYEADIASMLLGQPVPMLDGKATMKGKGWGYGVDVGAQFQLSPNTRLGAVWRSTVTPKVKGDYRVDIPTLYSQLAAGLGLSLESEVQKADARVKLPASLGLAWQQRLTTAMTLHTAFQRTFWSRFDELRIRVDNTPDQVQVERWRDANRYAVGINYQLSDALALKAGLALDQTPVPNARYRHPSVPDTDRTWLTLGMSYRTGAMGRLDVAMAWTRMKDAGIDYVDTAYNRADYAFFNADQHFHVKGQFDLDMRMLAVQYTLMF